MYFLSSNYKESCTIWIMYCPIYFLYIQKLCIKLRWMQTDNGLLVDLGGRCILLTVSVNQRCPFSVLVFPQWLNETKSSQHLLCESHLQFVCWQVRQAWRRTQKPQPAGWELWPQYQQCPACVPGQFYTGLCRQHFHPSAKDRESTVVAAEFTWFFWGIANPFYCLDTSPPPEGAIDKDFTTHGDASSLILFCHFRATQTCACNVQDNDVWCWVLLYRLSTCI